MPVTVRALLWALVLGWIAGSAQAAGVRLIMVEQAGCRYCIEWDQEIAPAYPKSPEGRFAPLHRLQRGHAQLQSFKPVIYTPTFIVVRDGTEVGRVTGYAGKIFFWEELGEQLAKAGYDSGWGVPDPARKAAAPARNTQAWIGSHAY